MPVELPYLNDAQLWEIVSHDAGSALKAYEVLYNRHWASLLEEAWRRLNNREDAEEIVQEIFIDLYVRRNSIIIEHSISAWLHQAVRYGVYKKIRSYIQERRYRERVKEGLPGVQPETDWSPADLKDLHRNLQDAIDSLPDKCRQVFLLSREGGLSHHEIARQVNISQSTVEKHISKAIRSLRKAIVIFSLIYFFGQ